MKISVKSANAPKLTFTVDRDDVVKTDKAIQLPVYRKIAGTLVSREWFPLSQLECEESGQYVVVKIPRWLFNQKVSEGCVIH